MLPRLASHGGVGSSSDSSAFFLMGLESCGGPPSPQTLFSGCGPCSQRLTWPPTGRFFRAEGGKEPAGLGAKVFSQVPAPFGPYLPGEVKGCHSRRTLPTLPESVLF